VAEQWLTGIRKRESEKRSERLEISVADDRTPATRRTSQSAFCNADISTSDLRQGIKLRSKMDSLTPQQAQALFVAGGFLILTSLPSGSEFGIDGT
jgi:hypothetical protein